jgi:hypothetical protein
MSAQGRLFSKTRPTVKQLVRERLRDFALRQAARAARREVKPARRAVQSSGTLFDVNA